MNLFSLFFSSILVDNIILSKFLGVDNLLTNNNTTKDNLKTIFLVSIVALKTNVITLLLYKYILVNLHIEYYILLTYVVVLFLVVFCIKKISNIYFAKVHDYFNNNIITIITNSSILGMLLLTIDKSYTILESIIYIISSMIGYVLITYIFISIKNKLDHNMNIPKPFRGIPIALITLGIISMIISKFVL